MLMVSPTDIAHFTAKLGTNEGALGLRGTKAGASGRSDPPFGCTRGVLISPIGGGLRGVDQLDLPLVSRPFLSLLTRGGLARDRVGAAAGPHATTSAAGADGDSFCFEIACCVEVTVAAGGGTVTSAGFSLYHSY